MSLHPVLVNRHVLTVSEINTKISIGIVKKIHGGVIVPLTENSKVGSGVSTIAH